MRISVEEPRAHQHHGDMAMNDYTLLLCADEGLYCNHKQIEKLKRHPKQAITVDGILGKMTRKAVKVGACIVRRRYKIKKNALGGGEVVESLMPIDQFECWADIATGVVFRADNGRCLSTHQLYVELP